MNSSWFSFWKWSYSFQRGGTKDKLSARLVCVSEGGAQGEQRHDGGRSVTRWVWSAPSRAQVGESRRVSQFSFTPLLMAKGSWAETKRQSGMQRCDLPYPRLSTLPRRQEWRSDFSPIPSSCCLVSQCCHPGSPPRGLFSVLRFHLHSPSPGFSKDLFVSLRWCKGAGKIQSYTARSFPTLKGFVI